MNLKEFDEFRTADAVKFNSRLNPALFDSDDNLRLEVRVKLLEIAEDFMQHLGVSNFEVKDITLSGSNAAYTYTEHSDIDLHILVDIEALRCDDIYRELFTSKKVVYNDTHDIKVRGYDVELYVQDSAQPHQSLGEYSVLKGKWIKFPSKRRANFSEFAAKEKFKKLIQLSELALRSNDINQLENLLATIRKYRKAGLDKHGEFGPENLSVKALRSRGIIDKLYKHLEDLHSKELSLQEKAGMTQTDEDWHPNDKPPGPEFKPTMPQGTARVDVSDVYDWYKLGQHISNLKGLGKHDFGKGPPSAIIAFGSEDQEHEYIKDLEKTGLSTTDLDPRAHKKMKGQKVDPTYNVTEDQLNEIDFAATLDDSNFQENRLLDIAEVDGKIEDMPVMVAALGNQQVYFLVANGNITAFVGFEDGNLKNIKNFTDSAGLIRALIGYLVHKKGLDIIISPSKPLTADGLKWIMRLIKNPRGLVVKGNDGGPVDIDGLKLEWQLARRTGIPGKTGIVISENAVFGDKLRTNELKRVKDSILMPVNFYGVPEHLREASGYIPSESERNDPRFKTALTVDVKPDSIKRNAKKLGLGNIHRSGVPPTARSDGKIR